MDQRSCSRFAFRGLQIGVCSDAAAPLRWLEEFFGHHLAAATDGTPQREVELTIDPQRYADIFSGPGELGARSIDGFVADGTFEHLAVWRDSPDGLLLHDRRAEAFISIEAGHRKVQVVARRDHARLRVSLMRIVRELAMLQALHRGDLFLHCAAAVYRGRTVVIAGRKRSGKTTMLLGLLRRTGVRFLTNDRAMLDLSDDSLTVRGVPTIVKVRPDSLQYLPSLVAQPVPHQHRHYLTIEECAIGSSLMEPATRTPPSMSPTQLCHWLGVQPQAAAPLGALVFPRVDVAVDRCVLQKLSTAEATDRIRASLFTAGPTGLVSKAFGQGWDGAVLGSAEALAACQRLARLGAAWECRIGPNAFQPPDVWDDIIAAAAHSWR